MICHQCPLSPSLSDSALSLIHPCSRSAGAAQHSHAAPATDAANATAANAATTAAANAASAAASTAVASTAATATGRRVEPTHGSDSNAKRGHSTCAIDDADRQSFSAWHPATGSATAHRHEWPCARAASSQAWAGACAAAGQSLA